MKKMTRALAALLVLVMVLGMVPPMEIRAEDYVISIHNAEEFLAIMDNPGGSYRLEADISLGNIIPLGYDAQTGYVTSFTGSLDGNGHTVSYSMGHVPGCNYYGLFATTSGVEIIALTVDANIQVSTQEEKTFYVGALCGSTGAVSSFAELNLRGSIQFSGFHENGVVNLGGVAGNDSYGNHVLNTIHSDLNISAQCSAEFQVNYAALLARSQAVNCVVGGSADLQGEMGTVTIFPTANLSKSTQNITIFTSYRVSVLGCGGGSSNELSGRISVEEMGTNMSGASVIMLQDCLDSKFSGTVSCYPITGCNVTAILAKKCQNARVEGNIFVRGRFGGSVTGLESCTDSSLSGSIIAENYGSSTLYAYGLNLCDRCSFSGSMETGSGGETVVYGARQGTDCHVRGDITFSSNEDPDLDIYGLSGIQQGSYTGSIQVNSGGSPDVTGANGGTYNVLCANITVSSPDSRVWGMSGCIASSYEGSIQADNNSVIQGSYGGSYCKFSGPLKGRKCTGVSGIGSYYSGNITSTYSACPVNDARSYASGTVVVKGTDGAQISNSGLFNGSMVVSTETGSLSMIVEEGDSCYYTHKQAGLSGTPQSVLDQNTYGESYIQWHPNHSACDYPGHENLYRYRHVNYDPQHYVTVVSAMIRDRSANSPEDLDFGGVIDPVNDTFTPDLEPSSYTLRLVNTDGNPIANARIGISGVFYYPDEDGCVDIVQDDAVISPLEVELKSGDGEYFQVLTRRAYYPIPNQVNEIRLEPSSAEFAITMTAPDASGEESGESWGGIEVNLFGETDNVLSLPMEINLKGLGMEFSFKDYILEGGRKVNTVSLGVNPTAAKVNSIMGSDAAINNELNNVRPKKPGAKLLGLDWSMAAVGYFESEFSAETNSYRITNSRMGMKIGASKRFTHHLPLLFGLTYVTAKVDAHGEGMIGVKETPNALSDQVVELQPYGTLKLGGGLEVGAGVGVRCANIYAEIAGGGTLDGTWKLPHVSARESLSVSSKVTLTWESRFLHLGTKGTLYEHTFQLWPQPTTAQTLLSDGAGYEVLPRTYLYLDQNGQGVAPRMESDGSAAAPLAEDSNDYPYAIVQLIALDDGRYVLLYTDDDISRGDADRSALRACIGTDVDGQILWGEAVTIENDGTADYAFTACASSNEVAVVWQDMNTTFGDGKGITTADAASHMDLTQAVLDCSGDVPQVTRVTALTSDSTYESLPMIFYQNYGDGENLRTAWVSCSQNDPTAASANATYTLWLSEGFGQAGQMVKKGMPAVTGIALYGSELLWSTQVGATGDLWFRDSEGNVSRQRESGVMNLQSVGHRYLFTEGTTCMTGEWDFASCAERNYSNANTGLIRLGSDGSIYSCETGMESSRVFKLDGDIARPVAQFDGFLSSWDAARGHLVTLIRSGFEDTDPAYMMSQAEQELSVLELGQVYCDNKEALPGSTVNLVLDVTNEGTKGINEVWVPVKVVAADGTELYSSRKKMQMETGETVELEISFHVPEGFTAQDVTVHVGDFSRTIVLGGTNLAVDAAWDSYAPGGVDVTVVNTGMAEASGTVTVKDSAGKVLASQEVTVAQESLVYLRLDFGKVFTQDTQVTVTLTEAENALYSDDNEVVLYVSASEAPQQPENPQNPTQPNQPGDPGTNPENPFVDVKEGKYYYDAVLWAVENGITTGKTATTFEPDEPCTRKQIVTFLWRSAGEPEPERMDNPFTDVKHDRFEKAILWAYYAGITTGTGDGTTFSPENPCTRKQIVTFLWRYYGEPQAQTTANPFTDVKADRFQNAILWAYENGITTGKTATTFQPEATCTRCQIVTFLYRADQLR